MQFHGQADAELTLDSHNQANHVNGVEPEALAQVGRIVGQVVRFAHLFLEQGHERRPQRFTIHHELLP